MKKLLITTVALALAGGASAQTSVPAGDITTNTTWSGEIVMEGPVFVKDGATLTILAGTIVRGQPRTAAIEEGETVGTPGTLIITQTGRIDAEGAPDNPIIFTSAAVDNDNNGLPDDDDADTFLDAWVSGDTFYDDTPKTDPLAPLNVAGNGNVQLWGSLVILGNAPTNNADKQGVGFGEATVEGLTFPGFDAADAKYGGVLPHDNSGTLRYVSLRHGGDELGAGNELNGISLAGVGDGTVIEFIDVYATFDDGIEWFGGTVNGRNLSVAFVGDDMFDLDEGYTGVNQFLFGVMPFFDEDDADPFGSASGDKGGEFDGDNHFPDDPTFDFNTTLRRDADLGSPTEDPTPWPLSHPGMWQMTIIGSTPDAGQEFVPVDAASANRGVQMRNGYAGWVANSMIVNTGSRSCVEVDDDLGDGAPGFDTTNNVASGAGTRLALVAVMSTTCQDGAAPAGDTATALSNGDTINGFIGGTANSINSGSFNGLENEDQTFDPTGDASGKLTAGIKTTKLDPRPKFGLTGVVGGVPPQDSGLDRNATYRGAFLRTAPELWTTGWTTLNLGNVLAD